MEQEKGNSRFDQIQAAIMLPITIAFILLGGFSWINDLAQATSEQMILQGLVFGGILIALSQIISLPFSIYSTFVIERIKALRAFEGE